jgi:hypothetical protein
MPSTHVFFIPMIFFLGFFFGAIITQSRLGRGFTGPAQARHKRNLFWALGLFVAVLVSTHVFSTAGGSAALEATLQGSPLLDKVPSFSAEEVHARLAGYGESGRRAYQKFTFTADVVFPVSLLFLILSISNLVLARTATTPVFRALLFVLPVLWFFSDMLENAVIYELLAGFPNETKWLSKIIGHITMAKFGLLAGSIALAAVISAVYTTTIENTLSESDLHSAQAT